MTDYAPRPDAADLLKKALELIESVPYSVTSRWAFYQMVQSFGLSKGSYSRFLGLTSKARKRFWGGWSPKTLADDTRAIVELEDGIGTLGDWLRAVRDLEPGFPVVAGQRVILQVWFEAAAMAGQFQHYLGGLRVDLVPFQGDPSIRHKWEIAQRLRALYEKYRKPIVILYFGDYDPKGLTIPQSALADIWPWIGHLDGISDQLLCDGRHNWKTKDDRFRFIRCGLNADQLDTLDIPENPERPGTYQWEALADHQARDLILGAVRPWWSEKEIADVRRREMMVGEAWKEWLGPRIGVVADLLSKRRGGRRRRSR